MNAPARAAAALALAACIAVVAGAQQAGAPDGTHTFDATWTATGERHTLPAEGGRTAVIVRLSGALVLDVGEGLPRGFRAEAIGFDDGGGAGIGRAVWTDDRGDRVFSTFTGNAGESGRRIAGTITGGTGRYAGLTGRYGFTWAYVLPGDDGRIHARTVGLTGTYSREATR